MKRTAAILLLLLPLLIQSCRDKDNVDPAFIASQDLGFSIGGVANFTFNPLTCQTGFNSQHKKVWMHSDTMSDYVTAELSDIPVSKGQRLTADLKWTTARNVKTKKATSFKVAKIEGETVWLWNSSEKIGLCVRIPD
jgi:hypothetical protein